MAARHSWVILGSLVPQPMRNGWTTSELFSFSADGKSNTIAFIYLHMGHITPLLSASHALTCQDVCVSRSDGFDLDDARLCGLKTDNKLT